MEGTVTAFDGGTRCGSIQDDLTEKRYHFSAVSFAFPVKLGMRFSFDWTQDANMRRVAVNMRRIENAATQF